MTDEERHAYLTQIREAKDDAELLATSEELSKRPPDVATKVLQRGIGAIIVERGGKMD